MVVVVAGFLVVVGTICGVVAAFLAHGVLWGLFRPHVAGTAAGLSGGLLCASMVFGFFWALNPDPPEGKGGRPDAGGTAVMTALSSFVWLPLYLYAFTGISRRYRRGALE